MQFGDQPLDRCEGAILAHSLLIGGKRLAKGRVLSAADIDAARSSGVARLTVARLEPGDVGEAEAATAVGHALAGPGLAALPPVHGRVNLVAGAAGLVCFDRDALAGLNAIDEAITVGTALPFVRLAAGEIAATIKIIPYAVPRDALDRALAAATAAHLSLAAFGPRRVRLIQTRLPGQSDKLFAKTVEVTRARVEALGGQLTATVECPHDASLAAELRDRSEDILLVAGASATADRRDVVPAAIEAAGGRVIRVGMPVDPGNLLVLGELAGKPVLGLPGCARSSKRNGVDLVLERLFAGLPVDAAAVAAMGVGGLLPDLASRPEPRARIRNASGPIGAILLAAGKSSRMGEINKLTTLLNGRPLIAHAADAIAAVGLPLLVVTGNSPDAIHAALGNRAAQFVHAPDFAEGLSRSLRAGALAVPPDWRGALVCLGDMPRITAALLVKLIAAPASESSIVIPTSGGKRGNPVLWGRAHLPRLAALEGDVGGKALLGELSEHVVEIEVGGDAIFADVDTPADLAALSA